MIRGGSRWRHALAAAVFLGCALWAMRAILPAPATTFPVPISLPRAWRQIVQADQKLSAANITWNAHRMLTDWRSLYDPGQCYPASDAATLGPHQLGEGLIGVPLWALTGDPVLTYNSVAVLVLWLPALAMYALVYTLTGSAAGAFVAGLLFGIHPTRITDVIHPDVHGNYWAALALLFASRLLTSARWRDAAWLLLFLALQVLGSLYQLLGFVIIGGTYGLFALTRTFRRLPALAPKLAAVALGTGMMAWLVFGPYLRTRAAWGILAGRQTLLHNVADFGLTGAAYPGSVLVMLAVVGLVDRWWRGPRERVAHDPRAALLVASALLVWASVWNVRIPVVGVEIPSLFMLAGRVLPGFDAIRAGVVIGFGVVLTGAVLAGYGVAALTERRSVMGSAVVTSVLAIAIFVEIFGARANAYSFGRSVDMRGYDVRPQDALIALYRTSAAGAVLDLPYDFRTGPSFVEMADGTFMSAFHLHPAGACYNSFKLPLHEDVQRLAEQLGTGTRITDSLHALGFETVVINDYRRPGKGAVVKPAMATPGLELLGRAAGRSAFRVESAAPVTTSFDVLERSDPGPPLSASPPEAALALTFRNHSAATFRHPDPIVPAKVRIRWQRDGAVVREDDTTLLLPIALAANDELARVLTVPVPPAAGEYDVTLVRRDAPEMVLARHTVLVTAPQ